MKILYFAPLLLLLCSGAFAQSPVPFYIGTHGFSPEWDPNIRQTHFVRGYIEQATTDEHRYYFLTSRQFEAARELGI